MTENYFIYYILNTNSIIPELILDENFNKEFEKLVKEFPEFEPSETVIKKLLQQL